MKIIAVVSTCLIQAVRGQTYAIQSLGLGTADLGRPGARERDLDRSTGDAFDGHNSVFDMFESVRHAVASIEATRRFTVRSYVNRNT